MLTSSATGLGVLFAIISQSLSKGQKQKYNFKGLQACIGKNKEERDLAEG